MHSTGNPVSGMYIHSIFFDFLHIGKYVINLQKLIYSLICKECRMKIDKVV